MESTLQKLGDVTIQRLDKLPDTRSMEEEEEEKILSPNNYRSLSSKSNAMEDRNFSNQHITHPIETSFGRFQKYENTVEQQTIQNEHTKSNLKRNLLPLSNEESEIDSDISFKRYKAENEQKLIEEARKNDTDPNFCDNYNISEYESDLELEAEMHGSSTEHRTLNLGVRNENESLHSEAALVLSKTNDLTNPTSFLEKLVEQTDIQSDTVKPGNTADDDYEIDIKEKLKEMGEITFASVKKGDKPKKVEASENEVVITKKTGEEEVTLMSKGNLRRNIREVMDETKLDESTLAAQRQEAERLKRVQVQQKILRDWQKTHKEAPDSKIGLANSRMAETYLVKLPNGQTKSVSRVHRPPFDVMKVPNSTPNMPRYPGHMSMMGPRRYPRYTAPNRKPSIMLPPSVSIAPVAKRAIAPIMTTRYEESDSEESDIEDEGSPTCYFPKSAKCKINDTIEVSSDDDCIVVSETEDEDDLDDEDDDDQGDPSNSGMHTNDQFNQPDEQGRVLVNFGHPDEEPDVFVAPQIARIIKPHQIGGVRFLYDNLIESINRFDTSTGFGCILAHSMGLGKTLQIVTFSDIFLRHTVSKTILCIMPINTLQNWLAEFNMWMPSEECCGNSPLNIHGEVRPRNFQLFLLNDNHKTLVARHRVIRAWQSQGGVLLMGYEQFRLLSMKKNPKPRKRSMQVHESPDDTKNKPIFDDIYSALVNPGPDLIICDEGHRIKNSHASISAALKQLRTKRRIVLTGYPLQNNLIEYWCMVDFVRPNYLGTKAEFLNMFERPIMNGQCIDSTEADIKLMRYRAHVLHSLLVGFVQRRSQMVLQTVLPTKEEYVLLIRMTAFQRKLYDTFMNEVVRKQTVPNPLKAFAVCCKIWNHPDVLYNFLKKRAKGDAVDLDLEEVTGATPGVGVDTKVKRGPGKNKKAPNKGKNGKPAASVTPYSTNAEPATGTGVIPVAPPPPPQSSTLGSNTNISNSMPGASRSQFNHVNSNTATVTSSVTAASAISPKTESSNYGPYVDQFNQPRTSFEGISQFFGDHVSQQQQQPPFDSPYHQNAPQYSPFTNTANNPEFRSNNPSNQGGNFPPRQQNSNFPQHQNNFTQQQNSNFSQQQNSNFPQQQQNNFTQQQQQQHNNYSQSQNNFPQNQPTPMNANMNFIHSQQSNFNQQLPPSQTSLLNLDNQNTVTVNNPSKMNNFPNLPSGISLTPLANKNAVQNANLSHQERPFTPNLMDVGMPSKTNQSMYGGGPPSYHSHTQMNHPSNFMNPSENFPEQTYWDHSDKKSEYNQPSTFLNPQTNQFNHNNFSQNQPWIKSEDTNTMGSTISPYKNESSNESKPKINIISDIKISPSPFNVDKKINIISDIKIEPKKEEIEDDKSEVKKELGDEIKTEIKEQLKTEDETMKPPQVSESPALPKVAVTTKESKEDTGIPYEWATELLKDYIPGQLENSAKLQILFCIINESIALEDRLLVFSQSLITLDLIEQFLQTFEVPGENYKWAKNVSYYRLDGSTGPQEREKLINEFNSNPKIHLFLVSTRAGSLGINLIGANRVVVLDASWNPCHDTQAVCRVYRYGQRKPCFVYRLVVDNCLEKKIYDRQVSKQGMSDRVVDECNPDAHLTIKDVTTLCFDDKYDEGEIKDWSSCKNKYIDVVLQKVLDQHGRALNKEPFQHESLLVDRKEKQLSQQEKRLAKRGYEREKNASKQPSYMMGAGRCHRPVASVRPIQQEERPSRWIPAEHWQRQGMTAQEMTLPFDVVIPTNQPEKGNISLRAGQKVLILKSPKGVYMQLENGKIVAIRTAIKPRGRNEESGNPMGKMMRPALASPSSYQPKPNISAFASMNQRRPMKMPPIPQQQPQNTNLNVKFNNPKLEQKNVNNFIMKPKTVMNKDMPKVSFKSGTDIARQLQDSLSFSGNSQESHLDEDKSQTDSPEDLQKRISLLNKNISIQRVNSQGVKQPLHSIQQQQRAGQQMSQNQPSKFIQQLKPEIQQQQMMNQVHSSGMRKIPQQSGSTAFRPSLEGLPAGFKENPDLIDTDEEEMEDEREPEDIEEEERDFITNSPFMNRNKPAIIEQKPKLNERIQLNMATLKPQTVERTERNSQTVRQSNDLPYRSTPQSAVASTNQNFMANQQTVQQQQQQQSQQQPTIPAQQQQQQQSQQPPQLQQPQPQSQTQPLTQPQPPPQIQPKTEPTTDYTNTPVYNSGYYNYNMSPYQPLPPPAAQAYGYPAQLPYDGYSAYPQHSQPPYNYGYHHQGYVPPPPPPAQHHYPPHPPPPSAAAAAATTVAAGATQPTVTVGYDYNNPAAVAAAAAAAAGAAHLPQPHLYPAYNPYAPQQYAPPPPPPTVTTPQVAGMYALPPSIPTAVGSTNSYPDYSQYSNQTGPVPNYYHNV